jgi:hypothetical protein
MSAPDGCEWPLKTWENNLDRRLAGLQKPVWMDAGMKRHIPNVMK